MEQLIQKTVHSSLISAASGETTSTAGDDPHKPIIVPMSLELKIENGAGEYTLKGGSLPVTAKGYFVTTNIPDVTYKADESQGSLWIIPKYQDKFVGTIGMGVLNMSSFISQKGVLNIWFYAPGREGMGLFKAPQQPIQILENLPDFQEMGWSEWT